mmetsp:Transcript_27748/g.82768  ORF Transcript_27748/g.82768 Transcript_27748/m.82768 type:complete len:212 (-) Transcript_27748:1109-1744(-)
MRLPGALLPPARQPTSAAAPALPAHSSCTRSASVVADSLRGCVQTMHGWQPRFSKSSARYCATCVLLPEPVSAFRISTLLLLAISTTRSRWAYMGRPPDRRRHSRSTTAAARRASSPMPSESVSRGAATAASKTLECESASSSFPAKTSVAPPARRSADSASSSPAANLSSDASSVAPESSAPKSGATSAISWSTASCLALCSVRARSTIK